MKSKCKCGKVFEHPIIKDGVISGEFAFHMYDTHGIPPELLPEFFEIIKREHEKR